MSDDLKNIRRNIESSFGKISPRFKILAISTSTTTTTIATTSTTTINTTTPRTTEATTPRTND